MKIGKTAMAIIIYEGNGVYHCESRRGYLQKALSKKKKKKNKYLGSRFYKMGSCEF